MSDFRLRVFVAVARDLSFTKASKSLHISQPAISKHIQELESLYGVRLFDRRGSGVVLTSAGAHFRVLAEDLLARYREIEMEMSVLKGDFDGELRVGASSTISQYVLSEILAKFIERFKGVKVSLISGNSVQIEQALLDKSIDIGLVEGNVKRRDFHYELFANDELVLVTSVKTQVAQEIELSDVKSLPLVLREEGSGTLDVVLSVLAAHNIKFSDLNIVIQLGSTESIKHFLDNSSAFAFLSIAAVAKDLYDNRFKVIDINELDVTRQFLFMSHQGDYNELVARFVEFSKFYYTGSRVK